jgi:hypothetical protein
MKPNNNNFLINSMHKNRENIQDSKLDFDRYIFIKRFIDLIDEKTDLQKRCLELEKMVEKLSKLQSKL